MEAGSRAPGPLRRVCVLALVLLLGYSYVAARQEPQPQRRALQQVTSTTRRGAYESEYIVDTSQPPPADGIGAAASDPVGTAAANFSEALSPSGRRIPGEYMVTFKYEETSAANVSALADRAERDLRGVLVTHVFYHVARGFGIKLAAGTDERSVLRALNGYPNVESIEPNMEVVALGEVLKSGDSAPPGIRRTRAAWLEGSTWTLHGPATFGVAILDTGIRCAAALRGAARRGARRGASPAAAAVLQCSRVGLGSGPAFKSRGRQSCVMPGR